MLQRNKKKHKCCRENTSEFKSGLFLINLCFVLNNILRKVNKYVSVLLLNEA